MMSINDLLQWWNLIYAAPLLVSLVWIVVTVMSGMHGDIADSGHGTVDAAHSMPQGVGHGHGAFDSADTSFHDAAGDVSDGLDGGHDIGDADGQLSHGHGDGHDGDTHSHDSDIFNKILWVLGINKVPIMLVLGLFMLCWGAFGLAVNNILAGILRYPAIYVLPSIGITFVSSAFFTRIMTALAAKFLPGTENYAVTRFDMIGALARTVYTVTETSGTINIKDSYGTIHREQCKAESGAEPIAANTEVIVIDYDENDKRFVVRTSDF